jgi:hypothetical protein
MASGGMNMTAMAGLATGGLLGAGLRWGVGGSSANRLAGLQQRIENRGTPATAAERARMQTYKYLSTRTFDPTKTALGNKLTKGATGASLFKDAGKGGYSGVKDRQAAAGLKRAEAIAPSKEQVEEGIRNRQKSQREEIGKTVSGEKENLATIQANKENLLAKARAEQEDRQGHEDTLKAHQTDHDRDTQERQKATADYATKMADIKYRIGKAIGEVNKNKVRAERSDLEFDTNNVLKDIDTRINARNEQMKSVQSQIEKLDGAADASVKSMISDAEGKIKEGEAQLTKLEGEVKGEQKKAEDRKVKIAQGYAHRRFSTLYGIIGTPEKDAAAGRVRGALKKHHKQEEREALMKIVKPDDHGDDHGAEKSKPAGDVH